MNLITKKIGEYSTLLFAVFLLYTSQVHAKDEVSAGMIQIGVPVKFSSIIAPSNTANTALKYKSNIPSIASVDSLTGEITGEHPGSAIITATSADSNFKATYTATVLCILPIMVKTSTNMGYSKNIACSSHRFVFHLLFPIQHYYHKV